MSTTDPVISDESIAEAIEDTDVDDPDFDLSVETMKAVLDDFQEYYHENDWDALVRSINDGHADIFQLSETRLVTITSYEGFLVPLEQLGYDVPDSEVLDLIRAVHRIEAEKHTDEDPNAPQVEPLVLGLPSEDP